MDTREEFEKSEHIKERLAICYFDANIGCYLSIQLRDYASASYLNGAWYAFREQQKKIDDVFLENAKLKHVIDQVKLHNGSLGFRSMQRMIEELIK